MSDWSHVLGDVIKKAREKAGLSQLETGRAVGIDNRTILNIENYRGNPRFCNIYPIIRFFKIDPRLIFYPELLEEAPALSRLQVLISECTEEEATAVYPVVQSAIEMLRNSTSRDIK